MFAGYQTVAVVQPRASLGAEVRRRAEGALGQLRGDAALRRAVFEAGRAAQSGGRAREAAIGGGPDGDYSCARAGVSRASEEHGHRGAQGE